MIGRMIVCSLVIFAVLSFSSNYAWGRISHAL